MKRLKSMLQRLKVRLLRLDVILHPLSGLLLSLKAGLRRLDGACQKVCVEGQTRGQEDMRRPKTMEEEKMPSIVHAVACSPRKDARHCARRGLLTGRQRFHRIHHRVCKRRGITNHDQPSGSSRSLRGKSLAPCMTRSMRRVSPSQ